MNKVFNNKRGSIVKIDEDDERKKELFDKGKHNMEELKKTLEEETEK